MSQTLRAARLASSDEEVIKKALDKTAMFIQDMPMHYTPPQIGEYIYSYVSETTETNDPYYDIKRKNIAKAFELYSSFEKRMSEEEDSFKAAVMLAIAGNVIDLGVKGFVDIESEIVMILNRFTTLPDLEIFKEKIKKSKTILYIGDNSGEAVFDLFLLDKLKSKKLYFAVRDIPVINDITVTEAGIIGIDKYAKVISSGVKAPGTVIDRASPEFKKLFNSADVVISKGQGNYEALSGVERDIFFLLIAKCFVIARDIGTKIGTPLLIYKK